MRAAPGVRTALTTALTGAVDQGGGTALLQLRTGSAPASISDAAAGTLLVQFALPSPAFTTLTGGALANAVAPVSAAASGTIGHYRVLDRAGVCIIDGESVGTTGSEEIVVPSLVVAAGQAFGLSGWTFDAPVNTASAAQSLTALTQAGSSSLVAALAAAQSLSPFTQALSASSSSGGITHGSQLTDANTGPYALLGSSWQSQLNASPTVPGEGFWRINAPVWGQWPATGFATGTYAYNNNPSNKGGYVPAGGLTIDGYFYPEGTYVVQFINLSAGFYIIDYPGQILFRGCRFRGAVSAPGLININEVLYTGTNARVNVHYCDIGGLGPADAQYHEVAIKISGGNGGRAFRNRISYIVAGIHFAGSIPNVEAVENYIDKLTYYFGSQGPNNDGDDKHIDGIVMSGAHTNALILRNKVLGQHPDDAGRNVNQTGCILFFQDDLGYPGTGTNVDGSTGYWCVNNYVGGTGYCIYAGRETDKPLDSVKNMHMTGNRVTTQWWSTGGNYGPIIEQPQWGQYNNEQSDNLWADGANVGTSFM